MGPLKSGDLHRFHFDRIALLFLTVVPMLACAPDGVARTPARTDSANTSVASGWNETRFTTGCDPGPYSGPPSDEGSSSDITWSSHVEPSHSLQLHVDLASASERAPILGSGFNLEHGLWSCPAFHQVLNDQLLQPFRPALVRIDTGLLPAAPPDLTASELNRQVYQSILSSDVYAGQWGMLRALDRAGVRIVLGVWGGPGQFTDDGTRRGVLMPEHYDDYVEYVVSIVDFLVAQKGMPVWAITIANEPDGGDGNQISPDGMAYIGHELASQLEPYGVRLYGPDTTSADAAMDYLPALLADPVIARRLAFVGFHQYSGDPSVGLVSDYVHAAQPGLPVVVTEYTSFDFGDLDAGQEASSPLDFTLEVADTLLAHYRLGADAALYWDAVDYLQPGHDAITSWGLLRDPAEKFAPREWYFGLRQILPYLQPGAQVLETHRQGGEDVGLLAIRTVDQRLALFFVNQQDVEIDVDLYLNGLSDMTPSRFDVTRTDPNLMASPDGAFPVRSGHGHLRLSPRSITTLVSPWGARPTGNS